MLYIYVCASCMLANSTSSTVFSSSDTCHDANAEILLHAAGRQQSRLDYPNNLVQIKQHKGYLSQAALLVIFFKSRGEYPYCKFCIKMVNYNRVKSQNLQLVTRVSDERG
jgi:hypothetical protein